MTHVKELNQSSHGKIRSAKIVLVNQKTLTRPLNHLLPLEVTDGSRRDSVQHSRVADPNIEESDQSDDEKESSVRQAAIHNITQALQGCTFPKFLILSLTIFCLVLANVKATMSHVQFCPYMHNGIYVRMPPFRNCSIDPG